MDHQHVAEEDIFQVVQEDRTEYFLRIFCGRIRRWRRCIVSRIIHIVLVVTTVVVVVVSKPVTIIE